MACACVVVKGTSDWDTDQLALVYISAHIMYSSAVGDDKSTDHDQDQHCILHCSKCSISVAAHKLKLSH